MLDIRILKAQTGEGEIAWKCILDGRKGRADSEKDSVLFFTSDASLHMPLHR